MAQFYILPVYKKALDLVAQFDRSTQKVPQDVRFGFVHDMHNDAVQLVTKIAFANEFSADRVTLVDEAIKMLADFKIRVRVLLDLHYITQKGFVAILRLEENLSRQLCGWRTKSEEDRNAEN